MRQKKYYNDEQKRLARYYNSLECKVKYLTSILEYILCDDFSSLDKHQISIIMYQIKSIMTLRYRIYCMENNKIEGDYDVNGRRVLAFLNGDVEFAVTGKDYYDDTVQVDIGSNRHPKRDKTTLLNNFKEEYFKFMLYRHGVVNN